MVNTENKTPLSQGANKSMIGNLVGNLVRSGKVTAKDMSVLGKVVATKNIPREIEENTNEFDR